MTLRISDVAVSRCSASCVSLKRRAFSMAIIAWSRKDSAWAISLGPKRFGFVPPTPITPMHCPLRVSGSQSPQFTPRAALMPFSCSGKSATDQSGT